MTEWTGVILLILFISIPLAYVYGRFVSMGWHKSKFEYHQRVLNDINQEEERGSYGKQNR